VATERRVWNPAPRALAGAPPPASLAGSSPRSGATGCTQPVCSARVEYNPWHPTNVILFNLTQRGDAASRDESRAVSDGRIAAPAAETGTMATDQYLRPGRLENVITLIQHLGLGKNYSLKKGSKALRPPSSRRNESWEAIARGHPEFFKVSKNDSVTLSIRYYQQSENRKRPRLGIDVVQQLVNNAIALHERQVKRSEVWKAWGTFIAAIVAAGTGVVQLILAHR